MKTLSSSRPRSREEKGRLLLIIVFQLLIVLVGMSTLIAQTSTDSTLKSNLRIVLSDASNQEGIPFANVAVLQNNRQIAVTSTDMDGYANFKNIPIGVYTIKAIYVGYKAKEIQNFTIEPNKLNVLPIKMDAFGILCYSEVITCCGCVFYERTENWWPKLWTPYREWYAAYKEKRDAKKAKGLVIKPEEETKEEIIFEEPIVLSDPIPSDQVRMFQPLIESLTIYPNPSSDRIHINVPNGAEQIVLSNAEGKIMQTVSEANTSYEISLNDVTSGTYYIHALSKGTTESKKLIVAK